MAGPSVFAGNFVKFLKGKLDFFGIASILTGTQDPTSVATEAPKGSLMMRQTPGSDGLVYKKNDDGSTTNWEAMASAANSSSAYADYYDRESVALPTFVPSPDGALMTAGQTAYFTNLSLNNGKIHKLTIPGTESAPLMPSFGLGINISYTYPVTDNVYWSVGSAGIIRKTVDAGANWVAQTSGTAQTLGATFAVDTQMAVIVGDSSTILKTTDGGATWVAKTSPVVCNYKSVFFLNHLIGWAGGSGGIVIKTTDGGESWTHVETIAPAHDIGYIKFIDANIGWLGFGTSPSLNVYRSTDGGLNWTAHSTGTQYSGMFAADASTAYVTQKYTAPGSNTVRKTITAGASWAALPTPLGVDPELRCMWVKDSNNIYVFGIDGGNSKIFKTVDGGSSWSTISPSWFAFPGTTASATPNSSRIIANSGPFLLSNEFKTISLDATWTPIKAFRNAQESAANGEIADIGLGTKYGGHYVYKTSSGQYHVNDTRRFFDGNNGLNFLEVSAVRTATLANNTTAQLLSVPFGGYQNFILDYSIVRGTTRETGMLMVSASETTVSVAPFFAGIGSTGVTFSGALTDGNIVVSYTTTNTGTSGTMKYSMRRWGN